MQISASRRGVIEIDKVADTVVNERGPRARIISRSSREELKINNQYKYFARSIRSRCLVSNVIGL